MYIWIAKYVYFIIEIIIISFTKNFNFLLLKNPVDLDVDKLFQKLLVWCVIVTVQRKCPQFRAEKEIKVTA